MDINIRLAQAGDIPTLTCIVNWHIANDHASFFRTKPETEASQLDVLARCDEEKYFWLVVEVNGEVVGSAKSKPFRDDKIYHQTVETGLCLHHDWMGKGIGTIVYRALLERLRQADVHLAVAGIAIPNPGSVALHKKLGFKEVGVFEEYACVHGKYFDSLWMQKKLVPR